MFVLCRQKADLVTPLLHNLYWLPIQAHIDFKITMLHYRVVHGLAPFYLCEVSPYQPGKSSPCLVYQVFDYRSFSFFDPNSWNALPLYLSILTILTVHVSVCMICLIMKFISVIQHHSLLPSVINTSILAVHPIYEILLLYGDAYNS